MNKKIVKVLGGLCFSLLVFFAGGTADAMIQQNKMDEIADIMEAQKEEYQGTIDELEVNNQDLYEENTQLAADNQSLKDENEQLKQENQKIQSQVHNNKKNTSKKTNSKETKEPATTGKTTTISDKDFLAKLLFCEAGGMSWKGQVYTCSAILNLSDHTGRSVWDLGHNKNTFAVAPYVDKAKPTQTQYDVIDYVLGGGRIAEICYFREGHYHNFGTPVCNVENHYFSKP